MIALGAWLARASASLGGPQTAVVVLAAGVVAGGVGGYAITTNQRAGSATANGAAVYPCPNQGPALLTVAGGQKLLVTGRLADDSWVRIHLPDPGRSEGWVKAGPLTVSGSVDSLPVVSCEAEIGASPAIAPRESLTAIVNATPSPAQTATPTPSPSPSSTPNGGPVLASLASSAQTISYDQAAYCPTAAKSVTISVKAAASSGVAGVTLFWRGPGATAYAQAAMTRSAGSATSGTWRATLNTTVNGLTHAGTVRYYAIAKDATGATSRAPSSGAKSVAVAVCANTGPTITLASSSSGPSLYWQPQSSTANCQTATDITAVVKDSDGVKSVTLFFRRPGSAWSSKPMNNDTIPGKWYANLDTLGDAIQVSGTLSWYIKAVDSKAVASQTKTRSIQVRRCNSPASIDASAAPPQMCFRTFTTFYATAADPDGLSVSSAKLVYTYRLASGSSKTVTVPMTYSDQSSDRFFYDYSMRAGAGWALAPVTWFVQTTDAFGGVSRSSTQKLMVASGC